MAANKKENKLVLWVCFFAYLLLLGYVLFFSSGFGREDHAEYRYNLTLFQEIGRYYGIGVRTGAWKLFYFNVIGNIVVFVPLGLFLPRIFQRCRNLFVTALVSLELSFIVEVIQLVTRVGSFDVDDLLLNMIGGFAGGILFWMHCGYKRLFGKK